MLIDTHCHLDAAEFDADRDAVIDAAARAGVGCIVIPAIARSNFSTVRDLAHRFVGGVYALGIHPLFAAAAQDDDLRVLRQTIEQSLADPRFVAIGEIGLDLFEPAAIAAIDRQQFIYRAQLEMAAEFDLPVLLHVRRSQDLLLKHLRRVPVRGGFAHAFNGSHQQAQLFIERGFKLGVGGAMTFARALQIRRLAVDMPADALVVETDAPDISPAWLKPARNSPGEVAGIVRALAELRVCSVEQMITQTATNACAALPRLAAFLDAGR